MIQETRNSNNTCGVARYRRGAHKSLIPPEQTKATIFPPLNKSKAASQGHTQLEITPKTGRQDPNSSVQKFGGPQDANTKEIPFQEEEEVIHERKLLYISDDSCNEGSCSTRGQRSSIYYKNRNGRSSKRTKDQCDIVNARDCSEGEECYEDRGASDNSSGSEAEVDDPRLQAHKSKMKKWTNLARGKFEQMLLECIVNTGNSGKKSDLCTLLTRSRQNSTKL